MKKWNIFVVGAVLGSLTESQIRRKLSDYQTLTGVDDAVISDLLMLVSERSREIFDYKWHLCLIFKPIYF